jgi:hypothetical protein
VILCVPIRIPASAGRGAERPIMDSNIRCPIRRLCCLPTLQEPRVGQRDHRWKANMNTLAHAEVRRNRLKNNTTRLSPPPDQAICNCWHKRKLAGYPTVLVNPGSCPGRTANACRLQGSDPWRLRRSCLHRSQNRDPGAPSCCGSISIFQDQGHPPNGLCGDQIHKRARL